MQEHHPTRRSVLVAGWVGGVLGCRKNPEPAAVAEPQSAPSVRPKSEPLKIGDLLPELSAEGWINNPPPPSDPGTRLRVIDIWAAWCPYCRQSAPGLCRIQHRFASQGVRFVSVTNMSREPARMFTDQFAIGWPSGYGLSDASVSALHVDSGMAAPGYEVAPVVYITGADNRIRWLDQQGRLRHQSPEEWERELATAIQRLLAEP